MDHVEAHRPWVRLAEDGVEVRAVIVEEGTRVVDDPCHFADVALEEAERGGVGNHECGRLLLRHGAAQRVEVDGAVLGGQLDDVVAGHRGGGGVRAVGGVGDDDLVAVAFAAGFVVGAGDEHRGPFALGACGPGRLRVLRAANRGLRPPPVAEGNPGDGIPPGPSSTGFRPDSRKPTAADPSRQGRIRWHSIPAPLRFTW